jgi:adenosylcobyric acid synthase
MVSLLIAGTASGVGKNTVTCGLIRLLRESGRTPIPFKALSIECLPFDAGAEVTPCIQSQAIAAGIAPCHTLNPARVIFPPKGGVAHYYMSGVPIEQKEAFLAGMGEHIESCLDKAKLLGNVVMEGSGGLAEYPDSSVLCPMVDLEVSSIVLVADAYNGGALASVVGTLEIIPSRWLRRVKAIVINRFACMPWDAPMPAWSELIRQRYNIPIVLSLPIVHTLSAMSEDDWPMQSPERIEEDIRDIAAILKSRMADKLKSFLNEIASSRADSGAGKRTNTIHVALSHGGSQSDGGEDGLEVG